MKIGIFGSCISRDIFREMKLDNLVKEYRARTSIHSITQLEKADTSKINYPESKFQTKMVKYDFEKTELNLVDCDFLILDLIDERFQLITNFGSVVTLSNELRNSNKIESVINYVARGTERDLILWREAVKKFSKMVNVPIILHKSRLSSVLSHENDGIKVDYEYIEKMNQKLIAYEKIIYDELEIIGTIDVKNDLLTSDVNHVWGYSPYHYIYEYYEEALHQIFEITNTNTKFNLNKDRFKINLKRNENEFISEIIGDTNDLSFAFYISADDEIVHKEWYSSNTKFLYQNDYSKSVNLTTKVFIKNCFNEIITINSSDIN
jgi:hypothetical protein